MAANRPKYGSGRCRRLGCLLLLLVSILGCTRDETPLRLGGGPSGGTYQGFAEALASVLQQANPKLRLQVVPSGGSVANLVSLNRGELDLGLVYAGDAYLGRHGRLEKVRPAPKNVRLLARLYGAAAQLVVRQTSRFQRPGDLVGCRVAIGNPGSGTAVAAHRYFASLGLWKRIVPIYVGFDMGLAELGRGSVDAVWMVVGLPNRALARQTANDPLRWLDLFPAGGAGGEAFFTDFPFYRRSEIPPDTYRGQVQPVRTFQDQTLLLARFDLPEETVYRLLQVLYEPATLELFAVRHQLGKELKLAAGPPGQEPPLHAGAARFWKEFSSRP